MSGGINKIFFTWGILVSLAFWGCQNSKDKAPSESEEPMQEMVTSTLALQSSDALDESGVYKARLFIIESANVQLKMEISQGEIEVDTSGEMRFGDRLTMSLIGGDDSRDVRFYSNHTGQVRIGTDSTFHGVVTVPMGEVYAYSRVEIHGAL